MVKAIHKQHKEPRDCLLHTIIAFLERTEPRPTWRVIVDALKNASLGLPALARELEAAHISADTIKAHDNTTGMSPSAPFISDWCSHVSIIPDMESAVRTTAGDDDKFSPPPSLVPSEIATTYHCV